MNSMKSLIGALTAIFACVTVCLGEIKVVVEHNQNDRATAAFKFERVPPPSRNDAATGAQFLIVTGARDENGGDLGKLHDGRLPGEEDDPADNLFFQAGSEGGRLLIDLGGVIEVKEINTYSWHAGERGPQVYQLYASDGKANNFSAQPKTGIGPEDCGWKKIAQVDARPQSGDPGGQYGVNISNSDGIVGKYRYLLFDISRTEERDAFGNTFYSEIDVVDAHAAVPPEPASTPSQMIVKEYQTEGGAYQFTIDTSAAPDLTEWTDQELVSVVKEWYPKLVEMLPSPGYEAAKHITLVFKPGRPGIPAATGGNRITCNSTWFKRNLKGEAKGSVVHEMVHVVQHYGRRREANTARPPGWLVEGIADYLRWFKYEPESHGAEITRANLARAHYDANYRISANFLNWVTDKYASDLVKKLNAALREGSYGESLWKDYTGHTVQDLGDEWRAAMEKKVTTEAQ